VDDEPIVLVGRIDRVDFHAGKRLVRILDYKTADKGQSPDETHAGAEGWLDLQLPLYRHLWNALALKLPENCRVELGYFNMPRQLKETGFVRAKWDDGALRTADETARAVIRRLREGCYWPPTCPPPPNSKEFAGICLENAFHAPALEDDNDGGWM
jgi:RecB family exonuclease